MLTIPVKFDVDTGDIKAALNDLEKGSKEAFEQILSYDKAKISVEYRLDVNGKEVRDELDEVDKKIRQLEKSRKRATGGEEGSIGRTKTLIRQLERQREETRKNSKSWYDLSAALSRAKKELNTLNGVQEGSIARTKELRADAIKLRDTLKIGSDQYNKLTETIQGYDEALGITIKKQKGLGSKLRSIAGTIAVGTAAFLSLVGTFKLVNNAIDTVTRRQKEIEGFNLALENIGLGQVEVNRVFKQAKTTADELGAPLKQIEKSYKRILPALQAVGTSAQDSDKFIEAITARTQTLGLNAEQSGRLLEAFAQVLSKGKLQAEELNQQISELDGAFRTQLADSLGVTSNELNELIKSSRVTADVFVKAVLDMENGVELLKQRIKEGRATIQQLQNGISNLRTKNLETIGKAIEPAIKGFIELQYAVEEFIGSLAKSEFGKFLASSLNNLVLGLRDFVRILIAASKAIGFFADPIFTILRAFSLFLRVIIPVGLSLAALQLATLAYGKVVTFATAQVVPFVTVLFAKAVAAGKAAFAMNALSVSMGRLAAIFVKFLGKFAAIAAVIGAASFAISEFNKGAESGRNASEGLEDQIAELERVLEDNGNQLERNIDLLKQLKTLAPQLDIFRQTGQSKEINERVLIPLERSFDRTKRLAEIFREEFPALIGAGDEDVKRLRKQLKTSIETAEAFFEKIDDLYEEAKGNPILMQNITEVNNAIVRGLPEQRKQLKLLEEEIDKRKNLKLEIDNLVTSLEQYNEKRKEEKEFQDTAMLALEVKLLKQYGNTAKELTEKEMLLASAQAHRHAGNVKQLQKELKLIKDKDAKELGGEAKKAELIKQYTKDILEEEKKALEAGKRFADSITSEVERVFKESSDAAQNYADIANQVASAVDKVRTSISSTLGTLRSATNIAFDNMLPGASPTQAMDIERARIKTLARINAIEHTIAQLKLQSAFRIQQIEAQTLQARLRGEAAIARRAGDNAGAMNLERSANSLSEVLRLNKMNYKIESRNLDLQKKLKDTQLVQQAMSTKIGNAEFKLFSQSTNRQIAIEDTNRALGTQSLTVADINNTFKEINAYQRELKLFDEKSLQAGKNSLIMQQTGVSDMDKNLETLNQNWLTAIENNKALFDGLGNTNKAMDSLTEEGQNYNKELEKALANVDELKKAVGGGTSARWMGGPVQGGQTYRVNDAGLGREAFMNKFGDVKMLPAGSNINWTAPSSGTIIPAAIVKQMQLSGKGNAVVNNVRGKDRPALTSVASTLSSDNSGNLVKQMTAAMSASGGNQRITNNVTIQSQQPVTDASQIMTNVARMRLRNSRRI